MRSVVRTNTAPKPAAAYEQAIISGDLIFVSGQVATNPATGTIDAVKIEDQVMQVLRNIEAIVRAAGGSKESIVRCGVFLSDLNDFAAMNRAYTDFFGKSLPARTTVQAGLGTLKVEIDAIAVRDQSRKPKKQSRTRTKKKTRKRA